MARTTIFDDAQTRSLGQVGEILVDANNGALLYDDATLTNIVATCERLTV